MKKILICAMVLCLCACIETKEKGDKKPMLGKYVYLDTQGVLHVKERCVMGLRVANENDEGKYKGVHRIEVASLREGSLQGVPTCSWCLDDDRYELLKVFF